MTSRTVTTVIDQLADELGRSVVINDAAMQMLHASQHFGDEDPVRVRALLNHGAEPRARGHVLAQGVSTWTRAGLIPPDDELGMHARVCFPVRFHGGDLLALLMIMDVDGTVTTAELGRINEVVSELAFALHDDRERSVQGDGTEDLVLDLVGADPRARRNAVAGLQAGGHGERFTAVTAVEIAVAWGATASRPHVEIALRNALSTVAGPDRVPSLFAVTGDAAVWLVGARQLRSEPVERLATAVLVRIHELAAGRFRCVAGVGSTGDGFDHAARSSSQAHLARRAAALGLRDAVASWESLGVLGPLLSIPSEHLTEAALPHELHRLRAVDTDGQLTSTLRAYLDAAGNGPAAAAALHIHRTSLYYRLGRIRDLTGLDVADGSVRLAAHVGFAMLDIIDARSTS